MAENKINYNLGQGVKRKTYNMQESSVKALEIMRRRTRDSYSRIINELISDYIDKRAAKMDMEFRQLTR